MRKTSILYMIMTVEQRVESLVALGNLLQDVDRPEIAAVIQNAYIENAWFTPENIRQSLLAIANYYLAESDVLSLVHKYHLSDNIIPKNVGMVLAGNIPLVGFHDIICCFLAGHNAIIKLSDKDKVLIPFVLGELTRLYPKAALYFEYVDKLADFDAVIVTGSDNTARHFEYYFRNHPHIIRYNRNAVAVLNGDEDSDILNILGGDIFTYFGLGCRNVSKIYLPQGYSVEKLFVAFDSFGSIIHHNKYKNNYDYNIALFLLNRELFLHNDFFILRESNEIASRIGVIHYEFYQDRDELTKRIQSEINKVQCIVSNTSIGQLDIIPIGQPQYPTLDTFADGIDTMQFLLSIS